MRSTVYFWVVAVSCILIEGHQNGSKPNATKQLVQLISRRLSSRAFQFKVTIFLWTFMQRMRVRERKRETKRRSLHCRDIEVHSMNFEWKNQQQRQLCLSRWISVQVWAICKLVNWRLCKCVELKKRKFEAHIHNRITFYWHFVYTWGSYGLRLISMALSGIRSLTRWGRKIEICSFTFAFPFRVWAFGSPAIWHLRSSAQRSCWSCTCYYLNEITLNSFICTDNDYVYPQNEFRIFLRSSRVGQCTFMTNFSTFGHCQSYAPIFLIV